jgi:D-aspartate ligase
VRRRILPPDRCPPLLLVKIGSYPLHHGTVAAVRSLGRLGVPVYAVAEDRYAPVALSRYLAEGLRWPTTGAEATGELVAGLRRIGARIGRPAVALATDDEAALLLAAHRAELSDLFLLPAVDPSLPGRLADKLSLHALCREHGVPAPQTAVARSAGLLREAVDRIGLPVVVKNPEPWNRLAHPVVGNTTVLRDRADLAAVERILERRVGSRVLVQEYLPEAPVKQAQLADWFTHVYCYADDRPPLVFTGVKLCSWPPGGGVTARGLSAPHPELAAAAARFCRAVGYRGVADLDWRRDARDGSLHLVDFNPRVGAQFQLFRTASGVDVVRALYLDLTGHPVPDGGQVDGRELVVEHLAAAAGAAGRLRGRPGPARPSPVRRESAWFAWDDPLPFAAATARFAAAALRRATAAATGGR